MADITIDAAAQTQLYALAQCGGVFWTSTTVGYVIYIDSSRDLVYNKTVNGGAAWAGKNVLVTGYIISYDCWADWQTAGDAGTKIHIACIDADSDDVLYVSLDTSDDSEATDTIELCQGTGAFYTAVLNRNREHITITKTRGGNLAVAFRYQDSDQVAFYGFYTSPDADTWTSKASPWEAIADYILLFPSNEADNQDVWAVFWDLSANEISLKTYDDSLNSWSAGTVISANMVEYAAYLQMDGAIRLSDGHLIFAAWSMYNHVTSDLKTWDINGEGSITAKTNVITDTAEYFLASVFINQDNDDVYVAYVGGTDAGNLVAAFYKKSDDGGASWGGQTAMQADAEDDMKWISCGAVKAAWGGRFQPVWFDDDDNDLFTNTDNGISIAAVGEGEELEKALSDTLAISDSIVKAVGLNKADTVAIADTIIKSVGLIKADIAIIADSISKVVSLVKADTVIISDTIAKLISLVKTDAVTITDSISKAASLVKADTMAIADTVTVLLGGIAHFINLFDTVTITDHLISILTIRTYLKQGIAQMQIKGMDIARMSIKRMGIDKMPLYRWITRRWTA